MTDKAKQFLEELRALCKKYNICLAVTGYDALELSDLRPEDDEIYAAEIIDNTKK